MGMIFRYIYFLGNREGNFGVGGRILVFSLVCEGIIRIRVKVIVEMLRFSMLSFLNFFCFRLIRLNCGDMLVVVKSLILIYFEFFLVGLLKRWFRRVRRRFF